MASVAKQVRKTLKSSAEKVELTEFGFDAIFETEEEAFATAERLSKLGQGFDFQLEGNLIKVWFD